mmetsp:Transcript_40480/g.86188  ORF Transcript_40480/g.86188 Transcript_40480/m.86188 type:complete len:153 (-) Transcript_40480:81-539(-)
MTHSPLFLLFVPAVLTSPAATLDVRPVAWHHGQRAPDVDWAWQMPADGKMTAAVPAGAFLEHNHSTPTIMHSATFGKGPAVEKMDLDRLPKGLVHKNGETVTTDWRKEVPEYTTPAPPAQGHPESGVPRPRCSTAAMVMAIAVLTIEQGLAS